MAGLASLVARRLVRNDGPGPRWASRGVWIAAAVVVAGGVALACGLRSVWIVAPTWVAAMALAVCVLARQLRPMLVVSVVGLGIGVASLFVVLGVASGVERALIRSLARLNGHAMVTKYGLDFFEYDAVADRLVADPRVRAASPFVFGVGAMVPVGDDPADADADLGADLDADLAAADGDGRDEAPVVVTIKGLDPRRIADFSGVDALIVGGDVSVLRPADTRTLPGLVVGTRLARRVGVEPGDRVRVVVPEAIGGDVDAAPGPPRHGEFEVTGLLDTGFAEFDATFVLMHLTAAQALVYGEFRVTGIEFELVETEHLGSAMPVAEELVAALNEPRTSKRLLPWYRPASWVERSATLTSIRQTKALIVVVLGLIVLVASGSLIGALLLLLRRKRRDIATLAALGAKPRQLFWIFELVGVGIGLAGSLLGLALGGMSLGLLALMRLNLDPEVYMIDQLPVAFVVTDLLVPASLAILMCALVSGPVARRAAQARPIEALR